MKYLCLCYYDAKKFEALSKTDISALESECRPHDEALHKSGHVILVGSLTAPSASTIIRPGKDRPSVANGPYVETNEPVGAFFIIEARDSAEAVEVASLHPGAHLGHYLGGAIEVRPCESLEQSPG